MLNIGFITRQGSCGAFNMDKIKWWKQERKKKWHIKWDNFSKVYSILECLQSSMIKLTTVPFYDDVSDKPTVKPCLFFADKWECWQEQKPG